MYLKIVDRMFDNDFETLTAEEKKEFVMGKDPYILSDQQLQYVLNNINNIKREYYNSLDLNGKILFAGRTNDQNSLYKIAQNPNLSVDNVWHLLVHAKNKDEIAKLLGKDNFNKLSDEYVGWLLDYAKDEYKDKIAELIIKNKSELSGVSVKRLIRYVKNKYKIAELLGKDNFNKLSDEDVEWLLHYVKDEDKDEIAELIIKNKSELSDSNVEQLLYYAIDKDKIAELIINKKPELSGYNVYRLISYAIDKYKIAELLGKDNFNKLFDYDVEWLLINVNNTDEMAKLIINKKPELSGENVMSLLYYANNKDEIAELLGNDNFNKLSDRNVRWLISKKLPGTFSVSTVSKDEYKMAQILNQYLPDKTPEMQELIDRYLK